MGKYNNIMHETWQRWKHSRFWAHKHTCECFGENKTSLCHNISLFFTFFISNIFIQGKTFSHWLFSHVALCTHIISTHIKYKTSANLSFTKLLYDEWTGPDGPISDLLSSVGGHFPAPHNSTAIKPKLIFEAILKINAYKICPIITLITQDSFCHKYQSLIKISKQLQSC